LCGGEAATRDRGPVERQIEAVRREREAGEVSDAQIALQSLFGETVLGKGNGAGTGIYPGDLKPFARGKPEVVARAAADFQDTCPTARLLPGRMAADKA